MVTKEWLLIKIKTIQSLSNTLKKYTFFEKDDGGRAVFESFLNHALLNMLILGTHNPFDKETNVDYKDVVLCQIAESIFHMVLCNLGDMVKPGQLYPMKKVYGIDWKANVNTTCLCLLPVLQPLPWPTAACLLISMLWGH
jgi:hypothetical protein